MKQHLFYTVLAIFLLTAVATLLGLLKVVEMEPLLLKMLVTGLLLEIAIAVLGLFKKTSFFGEADATEAKVGEAKAVSASAAPVAALGVPQPGKLGILVDQSHKQAKWRQSTPFNFDKEHRLIPWLVPPPAIPSWELQAISGQGQITHEQLKPWRGLIFGMPYHERIEEPVCREIVKWVETGGRLLLLGFELGERHHETNLNLLASCFGLRFNSDIVAPKGWPPETKPYDATVIFTAGQSPHPVLKEVDRLSLKNASTLTVEPGGKIILPVGEHGISQIQPEGVLYTDGWLKGGNPKFLVTKEVSRTPVIAEAPIGLTGRGRVLAIGTWDLLADFENQDNAVFLRNLFDWLTAAT